MKKEDILHLGTLSRITLSDAEVEEFVPEIEAVLEYVSAVKDIAGGQPEKKVGAVYNVFRDDEVTNTPGAYTERLLREAPVTDGRYIKVKKIIQSNEG